MCNRKCVDARTRLRPIGEFCGDETRSTAVISQLVSTSDSSFETGVGSGRGGNVSDVVPQLHRTSHAPRRKFCCCISSACNQLQRKTEFQEIQAFGPDQLLGQFVDKICCTQMNTIWRIHWSHLTRAQPPNKHPYMKLPLVWYPCPSFKKTQFS